MKLVKSGLGKSSFIISGPWSWGNLNFEVFGVLGIEKFEIWFDTHSVFMSPGKMEQTLGLRSGETFFQLTICCPISRDCIVYLHPGKKATCREPPSRADPVTPRPVSHVNSVEQLILDKLSTNRMTILLLPKLPTRNCSLICFPKIKVTIWSFIFFYYFQVFRLRFRVLFFSQLFSEM